MSGANAVGVAGIRNPSAGGRILFVPANEVHARTFLTVSRHLRTPWTFAWFREGTTERVPAVLRSEGVTGTEWNAADFARNLSELRPRAILLGASQDRYVLDLVLECSRLGIATAMLQEGHQLFLNNNSINNTRFPCDRVYAANHEEKRRLMMQALEEDVVLVTGLPQYDRRRTEGAALPRERAILLALSPLHERGFAHSIETRKVRSVLLRAVRPLQEELRIIVKLHPRETDREAREVRGILPLAEVRLDAPIGACIEEVSCAVTRGNSQVAIDSLAASKPVVFFPQRYDCPFTRVGCADWIANTPTDLRRLVRQTVSQGFFRVPATLAEYLWPFAGDAAVRIAADLDTLLPSRPSAHRHILSGLIAWNACRRRTALRQFLKAERLLALKGATKRICRSPPAQAIDELGRLGGVLGPFEEIAWIQAHLSMLSGTPWQWRSTFSRFPGSWIMAYNAAVLERRENRLETAVELLNLALRLRPAEPRCVRELASLHLQRGHFERASAAMGQMPLEPLSPVDVLLICRIELSLGKALTTVVRSLTEHDITPPHSLVQQAIGQHGLKRATLGRLIRRMDEEHRIPFVRELRLGAAWGAAELATRGCTNPALTYERALCLRKMGRRRSAWRALLPLDSDESLAAYAELQRAVLLRESGRHIAAQRRTSRWQSAACGTMPEYYAAELGALCSDAGQHLAALAWFGRERDAWGHAQDRFDLCLATLRKDARFGGLRVDDRLERLLLVNDSSHVTQSGRRATSLNLQGLLRMRFPHARFGLIPHHTLADVNTVDRPIDDESALECAVDELSARIHVAHEPWDMAVFNGEDSLRDGATGEACAAILSFISGRRGIPTHLVNARPFAKSARYMQILRRALVTVHSMALGEPCSYDFGVEHWPDVAGLSADTGVLTPATSHPEWVSLWRRRFRGRSLAVVSASAAGGTDAIGTCEALLRVLRGRGFTIAFVAHSASDLRIAEAVAGKGLASVALVEEPESMMALFGEATIHVGGRYHDVLLSGVAGCRIVALPGDSAGLDGLCRHMQIGSPLPWDCGEDMLATAIDLCQPMAHSRASVLADLAVSSAFLPERRRLTAEVEEVQHA